ncbi:hypothetical protein PsYK624_092630 [Phanerochaete sordida]|uniref:BTB domain-containing protein n=1 Tax=Phanerochaete sordida TaxID=48140 RepID=A0A9P3GEY4_9APHY|nr:hypothetical protein PsYK624_092630 [Phanerochaete sordida]
MSANTDESSRKRQRTDTDAGLESEHPAHGAVLVRDEHVWYPEGNIIITACSGTCKGDGRCEGPTFGYKCIRSTLVQHSRAFEGMFVYDNAGGPTVDEVPVVHLPDRAEDVQGFMWMMHGFLELPARRRDPNTTKIIGGALRLAVKYEAVRMEKQLRAILERDWPKSYLEWAEAERQNGLLWEKVEEEGKVLGNLKICDVNLYAPDPASVVSLAKEARVSTVLRAAWYELARSYAQGSTPYRDDGTHLGWWVERRAADVRLLDQADLVRLLVGREKLRDMASFIVRKQILSRFPFKEYEGNPKSLTRCDPLRCYQEVSKRLNELEDSTDVGHDPMGAFITLQTQIRQAEGVCSSCKDHSCWDLRDAAMSVWDALEDIFDLKEELAFDSGSEN